MASERLLKSTLALYHDSSRQQQADRVYSSTVTLLTTLTNPLNITLLTSHFLTAPAIWSQPPSPQQQEQFAQACFRVVSVYNTAAIHVRRHELEEAAAIRHGLVGSFKAYHQGIEADRRPSSEDWARAVAQGADAKSPRWRHLLVLVGVLLGFESNGRQSLSRSRRFALEQGVVTAVNLALEESSGLNERESLASRYAVVMGLNYAFPLLSDHTRIGLRCDALLPCIVDILAGPYGFDGGRILEAIVADPLVHAASPVLHWPAGSASFQYLQRRETQQTASIVASSGPVAAIATFAVERAESPQAVLQALDRLLVLSDELAARWAASHPLSRIDLSAEAAFLSAETAQTTWPLLWQHLKKILYAAAVLLQAVLGRSLLDRVLASDAVAPQLAAKSLRVLHNLYFISSRDSAGNFQAHQFAYLASIDILSRYPDASAAFLSQLVPPPLAAVSTSAVEPTRMTADLFYLNVAEHFATILPSEACDRLLIQPALPYLSPATPPQAAHLVQQQLFSPRMVEVFEAAHSATLSVLACPHNAAIAAALSPRYAEALFAAFPHRISPRQFRLAFKTLIQILSPPFPVYATHPDLAETLLEMLRYRSVTTADTRPLPNNPSDEAVEAGNGSSGGSSSTSAEPLSEQSALVLTLIDALPFLALPVLEDWMTTAAEALWTIGGPDEPRLRQAAQRRFWEVLGSGEMDVERAAIGVAWWGNGGGGELVMTGRRRQPFLGRGLLGLPTRAPVMPQDGEQPVMSGAIQGGQVAANKL